jgi:DNA-binding response OmpR family regulator
MIPDILLVEDQGEQAGLLCSFLEKDGYQVAIVGSGEEAISILRRDGAKLVLLDILLPGMDGFAVCAAIRKESNVPIMVLSALSDKEDQMNGLTLGADDYLGKPVDVDILRAKVGALMRRSYQLRQQNMLLVSGGLSIDKDKREVICDGMLLALTVKEYDLLLLFAENPGKVLRKEYLFANIWGAESFSENQTLTVHVKTLRDKIEQDPKNPRRIRTVWGIGYQYEEV